MASRFSYSQHVLMWLTTNKTGTEDPALRLCRMMYDCLDVGEIVSYELASSLCFFHSLTYGVNSKYISIFAFYHFDTFQDGEASHVRRADPGPVAGDKACSPLCGGGQRAACVRASFHLDRR